MNEGRAQTIKPRDEYFQGLNSCVKRNQKFKNENFSRQLF